MNYYTLNDIIEISGKSRSTIKRTLKEYNIEPDGTKGKANVYSQTAVDQILELLKSHGKLNINIQEGSGSTGPADEPSNEPVNEPESSQTEPAQGTDKENAEPEKTQDDPKKTKDDIQMDYIEFLKAQIAEKDKQLSQKDNEIDQLHHLLAQSQQLQLIAQTRVKELEAAAEPKREEAEVPTEPEADQQPAEEKSEPVIEQTEKKKSWWARIFGG